MKEIVVLIVFALLAAGCTSQTGPQAVPDGMPPAPSSEQQSKENQTQAGQEPPPLPTVGAPGQTSQEPPPVPPMQDPMLPPVPPMPDPTMPPALPTPDPAMPAYPPLQQPPNMQPGPFLTSSQLAAHSTAPDCYVAFQGKVYDITSYIPKHKNGQALLVPLCGTSEKFESAFTSKHGTFKVDVLIQQGVYMGELVP